MPIKPKIDEELVSVVKQTFEHNKGVYGHKSCTRHSEKWRFYRKRKTFKIMKEEKLVSKYVRRRKLKSSESNVNHDEIGNKLTVNSMTENRWKWLLLT